VAGGLGGLLDRGTAAQNDEVRERDLLAAGLRRVELALDRAQRLEHRRELRRLVHLPAHLWRQANARAVRATALVGATECRGRCPGRRDQLGHAKARGEDVCLESGDIWLAD